jgi:predicted TIM-barrel fold metal-dependent hydrolase
MMGREGTVMAKLINVHCHLLNYQFISPGYFKSRSAVMEWMVRHRSMRPLVRMLSAAIPGRKLGRLHEAFDLLQMDIRKVAARLRQEMDSVGIQLAVPLIMDMGRSTYTEAPQIPFPFQLKLISEIALEEPGVLMPFVMVDPRRIKGSDLLIRCLEEMGFLGVKFYPALGYHPDPDSVYNDPQTNDELRKIYDYCESNSVPMTAHCSPGGAYSNDILKEKTVRAELTRPQSWAGVLRKYPKLQLNLAHFGQDLMAIKDPNSWSRAIRDLIGSYPGVYTDVAYNKHALVAQSSGKYFEVLAHLIDADRILKDRILFGTDWCMTRHTWTEKEYVTPFLRLGEERLQRIGFENALDFLFPGRRFPARLGNFLNANGRRASEMPKWLLANLIVDRAAG